MVKLLTEYVENGIYHREYKEFTDEECSQMLQNINNNWEETSMLEKLESVKLNEEIKVIDKKVYAVIPLLGKKREINGCEARVYNNNNLKALNEEKAQLKLKIDELNTKIVASQMLDNELAMAGYCLLNNPQYKKVDGIRIKDEQGNYIVIGNTHDENCLHKEG